MFFTELIKQIFRDMRQHKLRSALAVFGIVWGTVTVVLLLSLGQGFYNASKKSMASFSQGTLLGYVGKISLSYQGLPKGDVVHLRADELMQLPKAIPSIRYISPVLMSPPNGYTLVYKNQKATLTIAGVSAMYDQLVKFNTPIVGRFINTREVDETRPSIFLSAKVKHKLFGEGIAIGETVRLEGIPFVVIGNQEEIIKGNLDFLGTDYAMLPYSTWKTLFGDQDVPYFFFMAQDLTQNAFLQHSLLQYLAHQHQFDPADKTALQFWNTAIVSEFVEWFLRAIQLFLGFCGAMTLGVGGVGLANTMYLIITQRTAEIGLRMAVGARDWQILYQFLFESSFLVLVGSIIGFILSGLVLMALSYVSLPDWLGKPTLSLSVVISTVLILSVVGLAAGFFPARRASKMTPIEALSF
jgi:putative ABC transport system permease protein